MGPAGSPLSFWLRYPGPGPRGEAITGPQNTQGAETALQASARGSSRRFADTAAREAQGRGSVHVATALGQEAAARRGASAVSFSRWFVRPVRPRRPPNSGGAPAQGSQAWAATLGSPSSRGVAAAGSLTNAPRHARRAAERPGQMAQQMPRAHRGPTRVRRDGTGEAGDGAAPRGRCLEAAGGCWKWGGSRSASSSREGPAGHPDCCSSPPHRGVVITLFPYCSG